MASNDNLKHILGETYFEVLRRRVVSMQMLTGRKKEVFDCVCKGMSIKEIGSELKLATGTVKVHLAALYVLIGVRDKAALMSVVIEQQRMEAQQSAFYVGYAKPDDQRQRSKDYQLIEERKAKPVIPEHTNHVGVFGGSFFKPPKKR